MKTERIDSGIYRVTIGERIFWIEKIRHLQTWSLRERNEWMSDHSTLAEAKKVLLTLAKDTI